MAGFGEISVQFIPDQADTEAEPPRFWENIGGNGGAGSTISDQPEMSVRQINPGRWPDVDLAAVPTGLRPGERSGTGRLMNVTDAVRSFHRFSRRP